MNPRWEEAIEGCLGSLATEKSHAVNTQLINRIALESFAAWMEKNRTAAGPGAGPSWTSASGLSPSIAPCADSPPPTHLSIPASATSFRIAG